MLLILLSTKLRFGQACYYIVSCLCTPNTHAHVAHQRRFYLATLPSEHCYELLKRKSKYTQNE